MSAPPRKPCRRQTFVLEIDPEQILIDLGDACEYHSAGSVPPSGPLRSSDDDTSRRRKADPDKNDRVGADNDDDDKEPDKQSRPPRLPSRRSTVRVGLDPDQLRAFEEWRRLHAAALQDDGGDGGECEFSDHNDLSSSVMDLTVDSTILSWVGPCSERGPAEAEALPTNTSRSSSIAPPKQPRRRSTLIVTLGQPQGLHALGDNNHDEYDDLADDGPESGPHHPPHPTTGHDGANGASFSEGSHATSVFVELFCRKVLEEQRRQESTGDPGSPVRRRRRSRVMPSPRASLRLRGPVRHLRQLMPDLDRIESVGTVVLDDEECSPSHPRPARGERPPMQPHRRQSAHTVPDAAAGRQHPTPENSTRKAACDLMDDDDDDPCSGTDLGGAVARKHDTHPVAPVRALSHQSSPSLGAHDESAPTGIASCDGGDNEEVDEVPTARRDENDDDDDDNDKDDTPPPLGSTSGLASSVAGVTMNKAMRESLQTVATEVSWESQDDDEDDIDDIDEVGDGEEDGEGEPAATLEWGGSGPIGSGPSPRRDRPRSVTCVHEL